MQDLETIIEDAFENRSQGFENRDDVLRAVEEAIALLDSGALRVAEKRGSDWHVNQWLKKAVLLSFALSDNKVIESGHSRFYDKVPMKYADYTAEQFAQWLLENADFSNWWKQAVKILKEVMDSFTYKNGKLFAEGVNVETIANEVGTPVYIYSKATFLDHLTKIQNAYA